MSQLLPANPIPKTPYRQIRALYDKNTITVYQAYSKTIAEAAVREQKLDASPDFSYERMTWIKPSWCWMMYRSGYALKDANQSCILALKISNENFRKILEQAVVCEVEKGVKLSREERRKEVRVQWDPERGPGLGELGYRSLQVGIGRGLSRRFVSEWVEGIEDVTGMAEKLRRVVEEGKGKGEKWDTEELVRKGCMPGERVYEVDEVLRGILGMES